MNPEGKPWTPSSIGLVVAGVSLIRARLYFVLLPPPLLPEDVRYMELPAAQLDIIRLRLEVWLTHFFRVMGGFVPATGVLNRYSDFNLLADGKESSRRSSRYRNTRRLSARSLGPYRPVLQDGA
jgi:hypothetical protein